MRQSVERKLTTILCVDVHGCSRLMEQDEAATLATLNADRDAICGLIARHRGRLVSTAGDGLLATSRAWARQCSAPSRSNRSWPGPTAPCRMGGFDDGGPWRSLWRGHRHRGDAGVPCGSRWNPDLAHNYDQVRDRPAVGCFDVLGERPVKNIAEPVPVIRVRTEGGDASVSAPRSPASEPQRAGSDREQQLYRFIRRALQAGFIVPALFVINLMSSPSDWWFLWPAMFIGLFVGWDALAVCTPSLAGRDREERP